MCMYVYVYVCVCMCVRPCARAWVCVRVGGCAHVCVRLGVHFLRLCHFMRVSACVSIDVVCGDCDATASVLGGRI